MIAGFMNGAVVLQIGHDFAGATSTAQPSDAAIGVSSNQVVQIINGKFDVFNKSAVRLQNITDLSFWANAGVTIPAGVGVSDPRVFFDPDSQRWFVSMVDIPSSQQNNRFLLAVSATADATGSWQGVAFAADPANGYFADFPTFGIDANGVYLSGDLFDASSHPVGPTLVSIPKSDLLASPPSTARMNSFGELSYATYGAILQPAVTLGSASSAEAVLAVIDLAYPNINGYPSFSNLVSETIQNASSANPSLGSPSSLSIPPYTIPLNPAEPGGIASGSTNSVDDGDSRISAMVYRVGDTLYATHGTQVGARAAVEWFKIDAPSLAVLDTGIISDPVLDLFYSSIAANKDGIVALVFNGASASNFVSAYAVLGEPINGSLAFGNLVLLKAGSANYHPSNANGDIRWGDYTAVTPDPADPTRFWAMTVVPASTSAYATVITELIAEPLLLSMSLSGSNLLLSWPAAAGGYQLQSSSDVTSGNWTLVGQTPTLANNRLTLSVGISATAQFFRLVH